MNNISDTLKMTVYSSLFAALIAAGAFIAIPVGPVPIVLQNMFVLMAPLILGIRWGLASLCLYLLMGVCGLPVFAGGAGGIGRLFGPTGGYLLGYIPALIICGAVSRRLGSKLMANMVSMASGSLIVYLAGVPWLKVVAAISFGKAVALGMYPFIIGDILKVIAGSYCIEYIKPLIAKE